MSLEFIWSSNAISQQAMDSEYFSFSIIQLIKASTEPQTPLSSYRCIKPIEASPKLQTPSSSCQYNQPMESELCIFIEKYYEGKQSTHLQHIQKLWPYLRTNELLASKYKSIDDDIDIICSIALWKWLMLCTRHSIYDFVTCKGLSLGCCRFVTFLDKYKI